MPARSRRRPVPVRYPRVFHRNRDGRLCSATRKTGRAPGGARPVGFANGKGRQKMCLNESAIFVQTLLLFLGAALAAALAGALATLATCEADTVEVVGAVGG